MVSVGKSGLTVARCNLDEKADGVEKARLAREEREKVRTEAASASWMGPPLGPGAWAAGSCHGSWS